MRVTPNYILPQFDGEDFFDKEIINDAFEKIDEAISDLQETFSATNENKILYSSAIPTAPMKGKQGDIVYNTTPTAGGYVGWICVDGNGTTLGTWKGFGLIQS